MEADLAPTERTYITPGWAAPLLVRTLLEYGHVDVVRELVHEGDWLCAHEWAKQLADQGRHDEALAVLTPFTVTGLWGPVKAAGDLLEQLGRADEAIALCEPVAAAGVRPAIEHTARLMVRHGRAAEGFELLLPHVDDAFHARALVDISAGLGRDEELVVLLRSVQSANAVVLLATVLERQGHVDEAIALLDDNHHRDGQTNVDVVECLADMLVRHGRRTQLEQLIEGHGEAFAVARLARHSKENGDIEGAIKAWRVYSEASGHNVDTSVGLLLIEAGRVDEGLDTLRTGLPYDDQSGLQGWCSLMDEHGRAEETFAVIDELAATDEFADPDTDGELPWDYFCRRTEMLSATGRDEQALEEMRARSDAGALYSLDYQATLLAELGRLDEALALRVVVAREAHNVPDLALLMIRRGQVREAIDLIRQA